MKISNEKIMNFWGSLLFFIAFIEKSFAADFCYEDSHCGPNSWGNSFAQCFPRTNSHQSPINLDSKMTRKESLGALDLRGFDTVPSGNWTLKNNGHTVMLEVNGLSVSGGGLSDTYQAQQLHFHWGGPSTNGSEHTVNGRRYPMEMHIVSMKTTHQNLTSALNDTSGLAVLGVLIDVADRDNSNFSAISDSVAFVKYKGTTLPISPFPLISLLPMQNMSQYYRYHGSLTTPPCSEAVVWTVYEAPIYVSQKQVRAFASPLLMPSPSGVYYTEEGANKALLQNNFRDVQARSSWAVYASKDARLVSSSTPMPSSHRSLTLLLFPPLAVWRL
ncbi:LOW QUALITY PROTEIN: carbonic anhydrase 15 [Brienomyrus brachyistius]|uniref:LOW QUALITY PROTEIN: carbonic anhydrase 15 n=1 Tax=Brienomyrus brachyistius TaxID=42636 RepID=UPI0020B36E2A|nr:LOW QUALITY PROTEIN: carbonic anhydrase 15 [Brienomyrus brachyistius]